jgi:RNA polymerase sigma-70 factor (sigma-E family)
VIDVRSSPPAEVAGVVGVASIARRGSARQKGRAQRRLAVAYEKHASELSRLAFLLTGDAALAEDLVHEAFTRALARLAHLQRQDSLRGYLQRTVVHLAGKHFRRNRNERAFLERAESRADAAASEPDIERRDQLWSALGKLPHRQRAALVLRFYEDLSERDTARLLGCRAGTVKSLVHRGLAAMRDEIGGAR